VKIVDANVLLYAVNESEPRHAASRDWLDSALSGSGTVGFAWVVLLAFLRLSTKVGLYPRPLSVPDALATVRTWTEAAPSVVVHPTPRHLDVLGGLLSSTGAGGNLTSDAHLAALAVEHDAEVVTFDRDFGRFPGVRWHLPAAQAPPVPS
jgi:uncharacterized protein